MRLQHLDMDSAACANLPDPGIFHRPSQETQAKAVCARCPIIHACREAAIQLEKCWGVRARGGSVYGGLTAEERHAEDRRRWPDLPVRRSLDEPQRKAIAS